MDKTRGGLGDIYTPTTSMVSGGFSPPHVSVKVPIYGHSTSTPIVSFKFNSISSGSPSTRVVSTYIHVGTTTG